MTIVVPPPDFDLPPDALPPARGGWDHVPLPAPVPVVAHNWPAGTRPLVTVLCHTYNHGRFIGETIDGILSQETTFPVQVVVHDDASTDGTAAIVRGHAERHPGLVVAVLHQENAFSRGIHPWLPALARGRYLAQCDGDDRWIRADKLERQVALLEADPLCVLVGARAYIWREGDACPYAIAPDSTPAEAATLPPAAYLERRHLPPTSTRVWRTAFFDRIRSALPGDVGAYDLGQALYTIAAGLRGEAAIRLHDAVVTRHRKHAGGIYTGATSRWHVDFLARITTALVPFFPPGRHRHRLALEAAGWLAERSSLAPELPALERMRWALHAGRLSRHAPLALLRTEARFAKHFLLPLLTKPRRRSPQAALPGGDGRGDTAAVRPA